jgi:peptidyl-prolyl cis-trans isomerase A (cyclophilin A)
VKVLLFVMALLTSGAALANPSVSVETTKGSFTIELDAEHAPVSVDNFLRYVKDGSYVGSIFHRIIPGFMVQGGGFTQDMQRLPTYAPIQNEASNGLQNLRGSIAMARTQDPNSATRQFFINLVDNGFLDYGQRPPGYAVFGKVTSGFDVIASMSSVKTGSRGYMRDVPEEPIVITNVTLYESSPTATDNEQEKALEAAISQLEQQNN